LKHADTAVRQVIDRLCAIPADETGIQTIQQAIGLLTAQERQLTQFAGWTPDGYKTHWQDQLHAHQKRIQELEGVLVRMAKELEGSLTRIFQFTNGAEKRKNKREGTT
jgi:hypothetical protein